MTNESKEIISAMKDMFDILNNKIGTLSDKMGEMQKDITGLKQDVSSLKQDVSSLKQDMTDVKQRVTKIETTLENEINCNIKLLIDGHMANVEKLNKIEPIIDDVKDIKMKTDIIELAIKSHSPDINRLKKVK